MGWCAGVWLARIPAAKTQAHLSDGTLGIALFAVPVGLVLGAGLAERLVDRVGSAVLVRVTGLASCVATMLPGFAHDLPVLMAGLFLIGLAGGTLDVSQNAQGVRVEAAYGRPVMTSMHAFYSLGAILGSLAGGGFAWAGIGLLPSLAVAGITGLIVDGTAGFWLLPVAMGAAGADLAARPVLVPSESAPAGTVPSEPAAAPPITVATTVDRSAMSAGWYSRSACSASAAWSARARQATGRPSTSGTTWALAPASLPSASLPSPSP